jgi:type IV secretion system protein VirB4
VAERAWAADWLAAILAREAVAITPEVKEHLWAALTSLASAPVMERTMTGLAVLLASNDLKQALRPYCVGGAHGRLLDAEFEHLGEATVQAFETEGLIGTAAAPAVLAYLFHRIEDRLGGSPTLIIIDEGWLALDDDAFAGQLREWLKTLRKKNASVLFATQSLSDIDASAIAPAIIESCQTRILLPNERAIEPQITAIYRRFGLSDRQIEIIAQAIPKREYYCQSRRGNRLFELGLSEVALALCAASSRADQTLIAAPIGLSLAVATPAAAQFGGIVYDPTNYAQNVLTAARSLQQINNQIQMLTNQATSLLNEARNLTSLPYSSLQQLQ